MSEMPKCDECGRFVGAGCNQYRRYDWQGVPVEDYLLCKQCETNMIQTALVKDRIAEMRSTPPKAAK